jgi:hypothetical protein
MIERLSTTQRVVCGVLLAIGVSHFAEPGNPTDIIGVKREMRDADELNADKKMELYRAEDPEGQYELLYAEDPIHPHTVYSGDMGDAHGLIGWLHGAWGRRVSSEVGQACFGGSMYDTEGPLTETYQELPLDPYAVAEAVPEANGGVAIYPTDPRTVANHEPPLRFTPDANGILKPADATTLEAFSAYGTQYAPCDPNKGL